MIAPIGQQIAQLRSKRGLSVRQLADLCGIDYSNLSKIERGSYNASIAVINKILTALDAHLRIVENMTTLEELRDFINENEDWNLEVSNIIAKNGWTDETGDTWGVCSDGKRRIILDDNATAEIINIED